MTRRARRTATVAAALCLGLPLAAYADPPGTGIDVLDGLILTACRSVPVVRPFTPYAEQSDGTPASSGLLLTPSRRGASLWFFENGGAIATLSCDASGYAIASVVDISPGFAARAGSHRVDFSNAHTVKATATIDVAYVGPDAPGNRPFGQVTVRLEVFPWAVVGGRRVDSYGCGEFHYLIKPEAHAQTTDPVATHLQQGACSGSVAYDAFTAAEETGVNGYARDIAGTALNDDGPGPLTQ